MPCSICRFSIWIFYLVFGLHLQTNLKPAFFLFFYKLYGRFCIFRIGILFISLGQKKWKPAFRLFAGAWPTSCSTNTPKYVKLSGAWPINLSGSDLAGPARIRTCYVPCVRSCHPSVYPFNNAHTVRLASRSSCPKSIYERSSDPLFREICSAWSFVKI